MAKFTSTTFGAISGRHGTAVAVTSKDGQSILRVYKAPSDPKSEKQVVQRAKFGFINTELSGYRILLNTTFNSGKGKQLAVSLAMQNGAIVGEYPDYYLDYSSLILSQGTIDKAASVKAVKTEGAKVKVEWESSITSEATSGNNVNLVFLNSDLKLAILKDAVAVRETGHVEVELPTSWAGLDVHCWIYFSNGKRATSASQYIAALKL